MPGLVAFGRRWLFGSDDFVFPGLFELMVRVSWLIAVAIIFMRHHDNLIKCEDNGYYLRLYLYGDVALLIFIVFSLIALIQNSMNGNIMNKEARKYVTHCLYFRFFLGIPEIIWNTFGTIWIFSSKIECTEAPEAIFIIKGLVISTWVLIVLIIFGILIIFDPSSGASISHEVEDYDRFERINHKNTQVWERRCKFILCSCSCGRESDEKSSAYKTIGKLLGFLFEDDLVPSDIACALIIMHLKNQALEQRQLGELQPRSVSEDSCINIITNEPCSSKEFYELSCSVEHDEWNTPEIVCHFMKFSLASYGWPWFLASNFKSGLCQLWENLLCCGCCSANPCNVEGDNCCFCHLSALKYTVKIEDNDLVHASFHNELFQPPFFVAIDHATKAIVVAIRGSMSLKDAITDLTAEPIEIENLNLPDGFKVHSGMLNCAYNVLERLNNLQLLEKTSYTFQNYKIVITGHSLGGGVASILSVLLKPKYPNLKCYAYSPPGGLMTAVAAGYCESFVTSIIVGDDIVGRLSVPSFEKFKNKLIKAIKDCKTPKYQILVGGCWYLLLGGKPNLLYKNDREQENERRTEQNANLLEEEHISYNTNNTYVSLAEVSHRIHRNSIIKIEMFPPGKIMHITERPIFQSRPDLKDNGPRYEWKGWTTRDKFREIKISENMLVNHYPDNVYLALKDIASNSNFVPSVQIL